MEETIATMQIVCHRGASAYAPENTFASAQRCVAWGVSYIEVDVSCSRDGVLYLLHGPELERTTNGHGYVHNRDAAYLDTLDAGSWFAPEFAGQPLPRLSAFLSWLRGKAEVFLDVKSGDPGAVLAVLAETGMKDQCFLWSRSTAWLRRLRDLSPEFPIKVNVRSPKDVRQAKETLDASIVEMTIPNATPELLSAARDLQMKVMIIESSRSREAFRRVLELGVEMINLDHADIFLEVERDFRRGEVET